MTCCNRLASALVARYVLQRGDRVATLCHNRLEIAEMMYGSAKSGGVYVGMNFRLKRIRKGLPLKKVEQTDAIFANVQAVRGQARDDPATLEISMDTKAKVALGDYVRGGKNPDRLRR